MSALAILTKCPLAKCPLAKCPLAKCRLAKCPLAKCPDTLSNRALAVFYLHRPYIYIIYAVTEPGACFTWTFCGDSCGRACYYWCAYKQCS